MVAMHVKHAMCFLTTGFILEYFRGEIRAHSITIVVCHQSLYVWLIGALANTGV